MERCIYEDGDELIYRFYCRIVPRRIGERGNIFKILSVPNTFIIDDFLVVTKNNKLKQLVIEDAFHPNASYNLNRPDYNHKRCPLYIFSRVFHYSWQVCVARILQRGDHG